MLLFDFLFCTQSVAYVSNEKEDNEFLDNLPVVICGVNEGKNERKERMERLSFA